MRTLIYLSLLIFIPLGLSAHHGADKQLLFGKWDSEFSNHRIKIKNWRHGIKAKDTYSNGWRRYRRVSDRKFRSDCGAVIKIQGRHVISFRAAPGFQRERFNRRGYLAPLATCPVPSNTYDDYGPNGTGLYGDYYDSNRPRRSTRERNINLEGLYRNDKFGHNLIILQNRNGIKTRIKGEKKWYYYSKNRSRDDQYTDRSGNRIVVTNNNSLKWIGQNGNSFKLKKISDNPF